MGQNVIEKEYNMRSLLIVVSGLLISSCSAGNDKTSSSGFEKTCVSDGNSEQNCTCTAEAMRSVLSAEEFSKVQEFAVSGDADGGEQYFQQLFTTSPKKMVAFGEAISNCSGL